jgi:hypothetical protein
MDNIKTKIKKEIIKLIFLLTKFKEILIKGK